MAIAVLALDLWSKQHVFATQDSQESRPILGHLFELRRSINDGAVFGFFTGQVGLFIVASLFAFAFVFYLFACSRRNQWFMHLALGLILAGALGNLYDRATMKADIVILKGGPTGETGRLPGKIVDRATNDKYVYIGSWPDGEHPRRFARDDIEVHQQGIVRDFIKFVPKFPAWVPRLAGRDIWPWVFNIADAALVCGVGALLCTSWSGRRSEQDE